MKCRSGADNPQKIGGDNYSDTGAWWPDLNQPASANPGAIHIILPLVYIITHLVIVNFNVQLTVNPSPEKIRCSSGDDFKK
ncbi:MAG: hypothetical protein JWP79_3031 [Polaromonas sp.]|jgi:hypothetical protein|nr:hypothetical protein [Polaromonas sp.]